MSKKKPAPKTPDYLQSGLYFIPLGGSEQFGVNLNVYLCDGQMIVVDCGLGFADELFPGIDLLLPDPKFLENNLDKIQAMVITHAHEDHIGAVPYLWKRLGCPIYTTPFTARVMTEKFKEFNITGAKVTAIKPLESFEAGKFKVKFLPVSHSIPDTCALEIETAQGRILHSGDWNLDPAPVSGYKTEAKDFRAAGDKGILAYIGDSTNAEVPGRAGSEAETLAGLEAEFRKCTGRVAVTIFSSNIGRLINIARAAQNAGRAVGLIGRSLHRMADIAREGRYLDGVPEFLGEEDIRDLPSSETLMIVTGSQGEPRAALSKIARGEYRNVKLQKGDTVIFSARPIPGNETNINVVKNNLVSGGVRVVTPSDTDNVIHVSGHPCRDELIDMYNWVRPKIVIPVHGERMQLEAQANLARAQQVPDVIIPINGAVIKLAPGKPEIVDHVPVGLLAVDQKRLIDSDHVSIAERRKLQFSGVVHVAIAMNKKGDLMGDPQLETTGLFDLNNPADKQIEDDVYDEIHGLMGELTPEERRDDHFVAEEIRIGLRRFVSHILGIKPKVTVQVIRI